jgi:acetyl esterase/lipase
MTVGDVLLDPAAASDEFSRWYAAQEVPVGRYARPVRLVHGTADVIPAVLSEVTAGQLAAAGSAVTYTPVEGADHLTLLPAVAPSLPGWVDALFDTR